MLVYKNCSRAVNPPQQPSMDACRCTGSTLSVAASVQMSRRMFETKLYNNALFGRADGVYNTSPLVQSMEVAEVNAADSEGVAT